MREDSRLGSKIRAQITRFSSQLGEGLGRMLRRLLSEMIYGIQAAEAVKVSEIARTLNATRRLPTLPAYTTAQAALPLHACRGVSPVRRFRDRRSMTMTAM